LRQHRPERLSSDLHVIGGSLGVGGEHRARLIEEQEPRLAATTINPKVRSHRVLPYG